MVAIVSGNSLGLSNTSAAVLGQNGLIGEAADGATKDAAIVNVSNGNLVLQSDDDFLAGQGLDIDSVLTYNAQGSANEGNGFGWSMSMIKQVGNLTGTVNTASSTITRTDGDGSQVVYTYNGTDYVGHEGSGADDTLSYNSKTKAWTWTEGSTGDTETYGSNGYITGSADLNGNKLTYTYTGGLLTKIADANGDSTNYIYNANGYLSQISDDVSGVTTTRVYYNYNALNQLSNVTTDLNPSENSIGNSNNIYWTNYSYNANGQINNVTQKDGAQLNIVYTQVNGQEAVQSVSDALGNTTTYSYGANNQTTVTDPLGNVSTYTYDNQGRLTNVAAPAVNGVVQNTGYAYDSNGDLTSMTDAEGNITEYSYDGNGNLLQTIDPLGDTTTNTYNSSNQLTSRTVYLTPAIGTTIPASQPETTYFIYTTHNQVAFEISAAGRVTQNTYNSGGDLTVSTVYNGNLYAVGSPGGPSTPLSPTNLPTLAQLTAWATSASINLTQTAPTHYTYNTRGQLATVVSYTSVSATGALSGGKTTHYTYDPTGLLLQTIDGDNNLTSYTYDGLGRKLTTTDANSNVTSTTYNDSSSGTVITTTLASGLATTSSYNAVGELLSVVQTNASPTGNNAVLSQTTYAYDRDGNLLMTTNPDGQSSCFLYDADGRQIASITADGELTETCYNADNQVSAVIQYTNLVNTALLVNNSVSPPVALNPSLNSLINPAGGPANAVYSTSWNIYDDAGRLAYTVDAAGYVTQTNYDGASNVIGTTAYATALTPAQLQALGTDPTAALVAADIVPAPGAGDRTTRTFYDADNLAIGTLNADGYLTEYVRDGSGQITQTIGYANAPAVPTTALATDNFNTLLAAVTPSPNDIVETNFYNAAGQLADALDGDGYLTAYTYDNAGNLTKEIRYATPTTIGGVPAVGDAQIGIAFSNLVWTTNSEDHATKYTYTALNQVATETDPGGMITQYTYDDVGNLISTTVSTGASDVNARTTDMRYNLQGQLIAELSGNGAAQITATSTAQQIAAIWTSYATTYTYDAAGNRTSMTDADGNRTLYYYDQDNRLIYTIDAMGDVQGQTYTNQGQVSQQTTYANRIPAIVLAQIPYPPGSLTASVLSALDALASPTTDRTTTYTYGVRGELATTTDALGYTVTNQYDAFGDVVTKLTQVDSQGDDLEQDYSYDNLGQVTGTRNLNNENNVSGTDTITAATNVVETTSAVYDAFGRVTQMQDANGNIQKMSYDQLGREISVTDPASGATEYTTYDAFDRVLSQKDFNGNTTTTVYDTATRSMTVSSTVITPSGTAQTITQTIVDNEFGQQSSVTDGDGNVTTYKYDFDGNLTSVTDKLGTDLTDTYDAANNLITSADANGVVTSYAYDAANQVLSKTVDPVTATNPNGLSLVTLYSYNTTGQVLTVTDPNKIVTQTTYDQKGEVASIVVDPTGLKLVTSYQYNGTGQALQVTDPNGVVTQYQYDALGRRVSQTVDPSGLDLTTTYTYDSNNNLISATDPNGNVTNYVYDADNRVIYTIDGAGDVTNTVYDADGNVIQTTHYANAINPGVLPIIDQQTAQGAALNAYEISGLLSMDPTRDNTVNNVYDSDNRLIYSVDGTGAVTQYSYDGDGNVTQKTSFATPIALSTSMTLAGIAGAIQTSSSDQTSINVYDARNRLVDQISGTGAVTAYVYDGNGNLIEKTSYATAGNLATLPADPTAAQVKTWLGSAATNNSNSVTRMVYDNANRLIDTATAVGVAGGVLQWALVQNTYDADGNVISRTAFASTLAGNTLEANATQAQVATWMSTVTPNAAQDRVTQMVYDNAGRLIATATAQHVNANGNLLWSVVQNSYDANGNLIATTDSANFLSSATRASYASTATWIASVTPSQALDRTSYMVYDDANREIFSINAMGDVSQNVYDANGNVITQVAYAVPVSISGPITTQAQMQNLENQLANGQSWSDWSNWVANEQYQVNNGQNLVNYEQNQVTATVYDADNRAVFQINALGYVTQNTYDGNGNVVQAYAYTYGVNPNLAASAPSIADVQQVLSYGGTTDRITYNAFDADNRLIYTVNANGYTIQNVYNALGQVTQTIQYAQSNSPLNFNGTIPTAADIVSQLSVNGYLNEPTNRITSFKYDAQGNLTSSTDALGNISSYTYNGLNEKLSYTNALGAVWNYTYDAAGNMVSETDPAVTTTNVTISSGITNTTTDSYTPTATTQTNAQLQTLTTYNAFGDVTSSTQQQIIAGTSKVSLVRLTQYQYDLVGRQTETLLPADNVYSATDNVAQNGADSQITGVATREETDGVTPTTIVTYNALGNAISNEDAAGNFSYKAYNSLNQVTYAVDADGYVTGSQYDAFGNVIALTRYANAVSIAPGAAVTTAMVAAALTPNANLDRVVQTQYDQLNQVTEVIDPASEIYGESVEASEYLPFGGNSGYGGYGGYGGSGGSDTVSGPAGSAGMVYDMEYQVTSNSYDAFGDLIEQSVTGQSLTNSSLDTVGSNTVYYYDNMGNKIATLTQADDGYVDATQEAAGLPTLEGYRSCFVKGTLIHTEIGLAPIEAISVGDRVLSQPEQAGDSGYKPVVRTFVTQEQSIWRVSIDHRQGESESLLVTPGHPFWVKDAGWTPANRLQVGQTLQLRDRSEAVVAAIEDTGSVDTVYNLEVADFHTYYVGLHGVWVHNLSIYSPGPGWYLTTMQYDSVGNLIQQTEYATLTTADGPYSYQMPETSPDDRTTLYSYDLDNRMISQTSVNATYTVDTTPAQDLQQREITELYMLMLGRPPYPTELSGWLQAAASGTSLADIAQAIYNYGTQTMGLYGDNAQLAVYVYTYGLGSITADPGVAALTTALNNGASVGAVMAQFLTAADPSDATVTASSTSSYIVSAASQASLANAANESVLSYNTQTADLTTTYTYDAVGNQTSVTDPTGATTYTYYNALGQTIGVATTGAGTTGTNTTQAQPTFKQFNLDIYGDVVQEIQYANGNVDAAQQTGLVNGMANGYQAPTATPGAQGDRSTETVYNIDGKAIESLNALGNATFTSYDILGRVAKTWESVTVANPIAGEAKANPTILETSYTINVYDADGNVIDVITPGALTINSAATSASVALINKESAYDAFGDVVSKSLNGSQYEYDDYDNAGNLWRTNAGNGIAKVNFYDLDGQLTEQVTANDVDLSGAPVTGQADQSLGQITSAQEVANLVQESYYGLNVTQTYYNRMGQVIEQVGAAQNVDSAPVTNGVPPPASGTVLSMSVSTKVTSSTTMSGGVWSGLPSKSGTAVGPVNSVTVNMSSVEGLGSGDLKVEIDYSTAATQTAPVENFTQSQEFSADQVVSSTNPSNPQPDSLTLSWGGTPPVGAVTEVQVWKKDVSGQWVLLIDNGAQSTTGSYVAIAEPQDATTPITVQYQLADGGGTQTTVAASQLLNFGDVILFNTGSIPEGDYNYTVTYQDVGDTAPTVHDSGNLNLVSPQTQITQLYVAILDRAPDYGGMNIWMTDYRNGWSMAQIAQAMYDGNAANTPGYQPSDLVNNFFNNALGMSSGSPYETVWLNNPQFFPTPSSTFAAGQNILNMISQVEQNATDWGLSTNVQLFNNKVTVGKIYSQYAAGGSEQFAAGDIATAASILTLVTPDDISGALAAMVTDTENIAAADAAAANGAAVSNPLAQVLQSDPTQVNQVLELYAVIFGRVPTSGELIDGVSILNAGETPGRLALSFLEHTEVVEGNNYPYSTSTDPTSFINEIFQMAFNRAPTPAEVTAWLGVYATDNNLPGAIDGDLLVDILNAAGGNDATTLQNTVSGYLQTLTVSAEATPLTLAQMQLQVTQLYVLIYETIPDQTDIDTWVSQMQAGASAGDIASLMYESAGGQAQLNPYYFAGLSQDQFAYTLADDLLDAVSPFLSSTDPYGYDTEFSAIQNAYLDSGSVDPSVSTPEWGEFLANLASGYATTNTYFDERVNVGMAYSLALGGDSETDASAIASDIQILPGLVQVSDQNAMETAMADAAAKAATQPLPYGAAPGVSAASIVAGIDAATPAATAAQETELAQLYALMFNNAPDIGGFNYWLNQLQGGESLVSIAQAFYNFGLAPYYPVDNATPATSTTPADTTYMSANMSANLISNVPTPIIEYGSTPTQTTAQTLATFIYTNVLGSTLDNPGIANLVTQLGASGTDAAGTAMINLLNAIQAVGANPGVPDSSGFNIDSDAYTLLANKADVGLTYALALGGEDFYTDAVDVLQSVTTTDTTDAVDDAIATVTAAQTRGMTVTTSDVVVSGPTSATPEEYQENDRWGNVLISTDPRSTSITTQYSYNANNQVVSTIEADGAETANYYDADGNVIATQDGNGNVNRSVYDQRGDLVSTVQADGGVIDYTYDAFGDRLTTSQTQQSGGVAVTNYTYNQLGELIEALSATVPVYTMTGATNKTGASYVNYSLSDSANVEETYTYDEMGRRTGDMVGTGTTPVVTSTTVEYELAEGMAAVEKAYDMTAVASSTVTEYNLAGNIVATIQGAGTAQTIKTTGTYDYFNHQTSQTDGDGNTQTWTYNDTDIASGTTTGFGQLASSTDMSGDVTTYKYDTADHLISQTSGLEQYKYVGSVDPVAGGVNAQGQSISQVVMALAQSQGGGQTIDYTYVGNQLFEINDEALRQQTYYTYDLDGNVISEQEVVASNLAPDAGQSEQVVEDNHISYDDMGREENIEDSLYDVTYGYDANGNRTHVETQYYGGVGIVSTDLGSQTGPVADGVTVSETTGIVYTGNGPIDTNDNVDVEAANGSIATTGTGTYTQGITDINDWNAFDSMNRETVVDGVLEDLNGNAFADQDSGANEGVQNGGDMPYLPEGVQVGIDWQQGQQLTYDTNGNRTSDSYYGIAYDAADGSNAATSSYIAGLTVEQYTYNALNQVDAISRDGIQLETLGYNAAGDQVYTNTDNIENNAAVQSEFNLSPQDEWSDYNAAGELAFQSVFSAGSELDNSAANQDIADVQNVYDGAGNLTFSSEDVHNEGANGYFDDNFYVYAATTGYKEVVNYTMRQVQNVVYQGGNAGNPNITLTNYDADGNVATVETAFQTYSGTSSNTSTASGIVATTQAVINDAQGQIVDLLGDGGITHSLIVDGQDLGSSGLAGIPPQGSIGNTVTTLASSIAASGDSTGSYTVQTAGETLQGIAQSVWGNSSLWYALADANNISGTTPLNSGEVIKIPPEPTTVNNNYQTVTPYNPVKALGAPAPTLPAPPPPPPGSSGCGVVGEIVMVIIAVIVTIYTCGAAAEAFAAADAAAAGAGGAAAAGAATVGGTLADGVAVLGGSTLGGTIGAGEVLASAAIGGAVGSFASQVAGNLMNMQSGINWDSVALGAIGSAVTAGVGELAGGPAGFSTAFGGNVTAGAAAQAATADAITQGIGVVTHLQPHFEWSQVAAAGITAGVSQGLQGTAVGNAIGNVGVGTVSGVVGGSVVKALAGGTESYASIAADAFGNALGNSIAATISQPTAAQNQVQAAVNANNNVSGNTLSGAFGNAFSNDALGLTIGAQSSVAPSLGVYQPGQSVQFPNLQSTSAGDLSTSPIAVAGSGSGGPWSDMSDQQYPSYLRFIEGGPAVGASSMGATTSASFNVQSETARVLGQINSGGLDATSVDVPTIYTAGTADDPSPLQLAPVTVTGSRSTLYQGGAGTPISTAVLPGGSVQNNYADGYSVTNVNGQATFTATDMSGLGLHLSDEDEQFIGQRNYQLATDYDSPGLGHDIKAAFDGLFGITPNPVLTPAQQTEHADLTSIIQTYISGGSGEQDPALQNMSLYGNGPIGTIAAIATMNSNPTTTRNAMTLANAADGVVFSAAAAGAARVGNTPSILNNQNGLDATNSANELALNGEGLFTNVTRTPYTPANQLLGQAYDFSCAAASCTMAANLADTPEAYVRQAILTDTSGTSLSNIPGGLQQLGFTGTAEYSTAVTTQSLADATSNGASVIVNVTTESGGVHAIVVDSITDGVANIRDPWPLGTGSSYGVPVQSLGSVLTGKGVIIHP